MSQATISRAMLAGTSAPGGLNRQRFGLGIEI